MYDSKVSDFNVVKATPYGKDILKDLQLACEKYGIRMGFYYSQSQDWDDPNGYIAHKDNSGKDFQKYLDEKCKPQVKELLENYGKIGLIWFDYSNGNYGSSDTGTDRSCKIYSAGLSAEWTYRKSNGRLYDNRSIIYSETAIRRYMGNSCNGK